jgi:hypothetical protein
MPPDETQYRDYQEGYSRPEHIVREKPDYSTYDDRGEEDEESTKHCDYQNHNDQQNDHYDQIAAER